MKTIARSALLLLVAAGSACGGQVVKFPYATGGPPTVTSTSPPDGATSVAVGAAVSVTFSQAMSAATLTGATFTLAQGATPVPGTVSLDAAGTTATLVPVSPLALNRIYTATVTSGAASAAGTPMAAPYAWTFTTTAPVDTTPPTVLSTTPLAGATGVPVAVHPTATFSEPMAVASITGATFTLAQAGAPVAGAVSLDAAGATATFVPSAPLGLGLLYTATITTGARDVAGNALAAAHVWTFTTGAGACSLLPVALLTAEPFAVLAGSNVNNTGLTSVTGDLGVSPGSAVSGFGPGVVIGTQHVADPTAAQAKLDLTTAFNDAAGRTLCRVTVPAINLGGQTLAPGLYWSGTSLEITSGTLTLDAQGDSSAVFIFQAETTLTTSSGLGIVLSGGAKASNVFWKVGTSATIGTGSIFYGTIMADQSVTMNTGASLTGRALARIAAVSLDTNVIVRPPP